MRMLRTIAALLTFVTPLAAAAQEWPSRAVRFIVPYPAGGSTDVGARVIADYLARELGQQFIVENKSGASGNIGFEAAARNAPDGYTVLIAPDQLTSAPHVFKVSFDPLKDFIPVIQLSRQPVVLAVHPKLGVGSVAALVEQAKQRPGLSYATSGVGSQQHMTVEWFAKISGIKLEHVPYRGGALGDQRSRRRACHDRLPRIHSAHPALQGRHLAAVGADHEGALAEPAGCADLPASRHRSGARSVARRVCSGGHPGGRRTRLNTGINKALAEASIRESFLQSAQEPVGGSAEAFLRLVREDFDKYARLVKELNIRAN